MKNIFTKAGFLCTKETVHANEYVYEDMIVYGVPSKTLNVVVEPNTSIDEKWSQSCSTYHSTALSSFPKRMNKGQNPIHYGIQIKFDDEPHMMEFLKEIVLGNNDHKIIEKI